MKSATRADEDQSTTPLDVSDVKTEPPRGLSLRAAIVSAVKDASPIGLSDREIHEAVAQMGGSMLLDLEEILSTLVLLKVIDNRDQKLVATDLTDSFLEGARISASR